MLTASEQGESGVSLVELLISILVGILLLTGITSIYVSTSKSNANNLQLARINQEVRAIIGVMSREIRRAGYWGVVPGTVGTVGNPTWITAIYANNTVDLASNPFWNALTLSNYTGGNGAASNQSCLLFSYDWDGNKQVGDGTAGTPVEQFGFRWRHSLDVDGDGRQDSVLEMRLSGSPFNCNEGVWTSLNDPKLTSITTLAFTLTVTPLNISHPGTSCISGEACQTIRQVDITLSAHLKSDASVQQTVTESVRIRNDTYAVL